MSEFNPKTEGWTEEKPLVLYRIAAMEENVQKLEAIEKRLASIEALLDKYRVVVKVMLWLVGITGSVVGFLIDHLIRKIPNGG